jgi:serine/threonine protein kinase
VVDGHAVYLSVLHLDFGLTYCSNGDLLQYITDAGHFEIDTVRFYSAELIEALDQLHTRRVVHRDLKVIALHSIHSLDILDSTAA